MYCKILPCEQYDLINQSLLQWINNIPNLITSNQFWNPQQDLQLLFRSCPLFLDWLRQQDIMIRSVAVTFGTHDKCCPPHIDSPPARFKLSWPVLNTRHTWNRWFESKHEHSVYQTHEWGGRVTVDYDSLKELHREELISPCIIDAGIIHDVWCDPKAQYPRIGLQCQLLKEPSTIERI